MFVVAKSDVRTIRQDDSDFNIYDGIIRYPRAMLHVTPDCPQNIRHQIEWAVANGYVKLVSHVKGKELTWEKLTE